MRNGWEVPNFFAPDGTPPKPPAGFARPHWFGRVGAECRAAAGTVGILDLSFLARFEVAGLNAETALDAVLAGTLPRRDGGVTRCPMLTARGGIATMLTVVRRAADNFLLIGPGEYEARDADDLQRRLARHPVTFHNVTAALAMLLVTGPRARELLAACSRSDLTLPLDDVHFPPGTARQGSLGYAPVTILRHEETGLGDWLVVVPADSPARCTKCRDRRARPSAPSYRRARLGRTAARAWHPDRRARHRPDHVPVGGRAGCIGPRRTIRSEP